MKSKLFFIFCLLISLISNGQICFNTLDTYTSGYQPTVLVKADFNADGNVDIVTGNFSSISFLMGTNAGSFNISNSYTNTPSVFNMTYADFNSDGYFDLATIGGQNYLGIILSTGASAYSAPVAYTVGGLLNSPAAIVSADFNGDSKADLAVAGSQVLSILLGNGLGSFNSPINFSVNPSPFSSPYAMTVGDYNGDGHLDLACANQMANNVSVMLGLGTGSFVPNGTFVVNSNPIKILTKDFNQDGKLDLATCNVSSGSIGVLLGTGTGSFLPTTNYPVGNSPKSLSCDDLNYDGKLDLISANGTSLSVILGDGLGNFASSINIPSLTKPTGVISGDLNSDNMADLAIFNYSVGILQVLLNCITSVGLVEEKNLDEIDIYPNPSNDHLTIEGLGTGDNKLTIYDLSRRIVYINEVKNNEDITIKDFAPGLYLLSIRTDSKIYNKRIIVTK